MSRLVPVAVVLLSAACSHSGGGGAIGGKTIRYQVEYFGSPLTGIANRAVLITYATGEGTQEQRNVTLPWTKVVGTAPAGFTASVKAQFYGYGTIVCRIVADTTLVADVTSMEEPYPTAECTA